MNSRGSTLIETLVYVALFVIIIGGGMVAVYNTLQNTDANQNKVLIQEEANFLLRKVDWVLSGISAITTPAAGSKTNYPTSATARFCLNKLSFGSNPVEIYVTGGNMFVRTSGCGSGGTTLTLNSGNVTVASSTFEHIAASGGKPAGFRAAFSFSNSSQYFETVKYLRK